MSLSRRKFVKDLAIASSVAYLPLSVLGKEGNMKKVALVGCGSRALSMWSKQLLKSFGHQLEFVGVCDINQGRANAFIKLAGLQCKVYASCKNMLTEAKPDYLIVTTVDAVHHEAIMEGFAAGVQVITEKPLTTDEIKLKQIIEAEKNANKKLKVAFNYRYGTQFTKVKELLAQKKVGDVVSVDFNWYLNVYHGADYFRRWHGLSNKSGTLLVHKSTHHFDLLNWWLDSDPIEVMAYGTLDYYGKNGTFRARNCRTCTYKKDCKHYWDIQTNPEMVALYTQNEQEDQYFRDACVFRNEIDIFDKMSVQIKYANGVLVNYSLTTYSPYEGFRLAFNGKIGRLDTWEGIPFLEANTIDQASLHAKEMQQQANEMKTDLIYVHRNFEPTEKIEIQSSKAGHGGGDARLLNQLFGPLQSEPLKHTATIRDGAFSVLIGVAARKSIQLQRPVKISELSDLQTFAQRP